VIAHAGCRAHVYRKFREAAAQAPGTARLFRADIKRLYAIEDDADERQLDAAARAELRQAQARPILAALYARARRVRHEHSEAGAMGKALTYLINQHVPLRRYLDEGRIPIDNNACERAIRPIAMGRRNWLFAGSVRGRQAAAVVYSLIECCRRAKVEMVAYLANGLVRIRTQPASHRGTAAGHVAARGHGASAAAGAGAYVAEPRARSRTRCGRGTVGRTLTIHVVCRKRFCSSTNSGEA
jgi:transposase